MPRPRSAHTRLVKEKLIARLGGGFHFPGQRFYSNRGLAAQFGISYQTADRLIRELVEEGWLKRRPSAGTYVSGKSVDLQGAILVFHDRAKRPGSFGARLLGDLRQALDQAGFTHITRWSADDTSPRLPDGWLPVLWECPRTMAELANARKALLLLNDMPPPGLASSFADCVACDDFSGGAAAAEILRDVGKPGSRVVVAGPADDPRSRQRVTGFVSKVRNARVFWASSWDAEAAMQVADVIRSANPGGVFCCNDRLAAGLLESGIQAPIVGFDDAPVAETLDLTTIAIPWKDMVTGAVGLIRSRIQGHTGAAAKLIFAPRPVMRTSHRCD